MLQFLLLILFGLIPACLDPASNARVVAVSVSSSGPTTVDVKGKIKLAVRAVTADGTSSDVTDRATCFLTSLQPGVLINMEFIAQGPGTTIVECEFMSVTGTMAVTVRGAAQATVAAIQTGAYAPSSLVEVSAVIFAVDAPGSTEDFYASDPAGGPSSGTHFLDSRKSDTGIPPHQGLAVGDVVHVLGLYMEEKGQSRIKYTQADKTGTSSPPSPNVVTIGDLSSKIWDGCLVKVDNVLVTDINADKFAFAVTAVGMQDGPVMLVDDYLYDFWSYVKKTGTVFSSITGVVYVSVVPGGERLAISPRSLDDFVPETTSPEAPVTQMTVRDVQGKNPVVVTNPGAVDAYAAEAALVSSP